MRRLAHSLLAAFSIALLAACSGSGGYGFEGASNSTNSNSNNTITSIQFYNPSNTEGAFRLRNAGSQPIQISATATRGSGTTATLVPDQNFTWQIGYAGPPTTFQSNNAGAVVTCPAIPASAPDPRAVTVPGVVSGTGNGVLALPTNTNGLNNSGSIGIGFNSNGFTSYNPALVASSNIQTSNIYVFPVPGGPASYCLNLVATHVADGVQASQVIFVTAL